VYFDREGGESVRLVIFLFLDVLLLMIYFLELVLDVFYAGERSHS